MRTRKLASSLLTALALTASTLSPTLAHAEGPVAEGSVQRGGDEGTSITPMPVPVPPAMVDQVETYWYGYQNLAADGVALALLFSAGSTNGGGSAEALGWLSFGTYALGSPIIHAIHGGGVGRSLGSAAMRLGLPVLGGVIGGALASCRGSDDSESCGWNELGGILLGGLVGIGTAVVIDDFSLANEQRHVTRAMWTPTVAPSAGGGMTFGVAGTF